MNALYAILINWLGPNWTIRILAVCSIIQLSVGVVTVALDGDPLTNTDWKIVGPAFTLAWAQLFTRANAVTSETAALASAKVAAKMETNSAVVSAKS